MHVMCMSGREKGANSTHFRSAHVKNMITQNMITQKRYSAKENHTKISVKLDCEFHALLYEIECMERAKLASQLVHPILSQCVD